jgi:arsenate-mycothiol transferase
MLTDADRVVILGDEARVTAVPGMRAPIDTWVIPDPADRGIDGLDRVRLMRDDIAERVQALLSEMTDPVGQ